MSEAIIQQRSLFDADGPGWADFDNVLDLGPALRGGGVAPGLPTRRRLCQLHPLGARKLRRVAGRSRLLILLRDPRRRARSGPFPLQHQDGYFAGAGLDT